MLNPAVNHEVSDIEITLSQELLQFTVAADEFAVPPYCPQDDVKLKCQPLNEFICYTVIKASAISLLPANVT